MSAPPPRVALLPEIVLPAMSTNASPLMLAASPPPCSALFAIRVERET